KERVPGLRIPGGGSKLSDCHQEFALWMGPNVSVDKHQIPKTTQVCVDNDPTCDLDPTVGTCKMRAWSCLGGLDSRLACAASAVSSVDVVVPKSTAVGDAANLRAAALSRLGAISMPAGPGEICTRHIDVVVPLKTTATLKLATFDAQNKKDADTLKL